LLALGTALETPVSYFFVGLERVVDPPQEIACLEFDRDTLELAAALQRANPTVARSVKEFLRNIEVALR